MKEALAWVLDKFVDVETDSLIWDLRRDALFSAIEYLGEFGEIDKPRIELMTTKIFDDGNFDVETDGVKKIIETVVNQIIAVLEDPQNEAATQDVKNTKKPLDFGGDSDQMLVYFLENE